MSVKLGTHSTRQVEAWVEFEEGEAVEGNYYAPDASFFKLKPSDQRCPFCSSAMESVVVIGALFGRIMRDLEEHRGNRTRVVVDLMPPSHEALKCVACETVLTRLKGAEAYGPREAAI